MNTLKLRQNIDLQEISFSELNSINGGNLVAWGGLFLTGIKFAMEASYGIGYAIGHYEASH